ncbi:MAG: hypothetical protein C5B52_09265 [Bacteroidetes bacterium]|nr:MAG: hypothetical protein C5B52_09265 [Bacteroidota bacterium]
MKKFYHLLTVLVLTTSLAQSQNVFTVTTTADNGLNATPLAGSFRAALIAANSTPNVGGFPDVIQFNIAVSGVQTLVISNVNQNQFPTITESVKIDGYSEPGSVQGQVGGGTRVINIEIDGSNFPNGPGLVVDASDVEIEGISLFNFNGDGIQLLAGRNNLFVWGSNIGVNASGVAPAGRGGNIGTGILIASGGLAHTGISIGTNLDGTNDVNEGNVISGNDPNAATFDAIFVNNTISSNFSGNFIGTTGTGNAAARNGFNGIRILNCHPTDFTQRNLIGTNGDNTTDAEEGNVLANNSNGVAILNSEFTIVAGNIIGLMKDGSSGGNGPFTFPTAGSGVIIWGSAQNVIGVNGDNSAGEANEKNFICSNAWNGITIYENGGLGGPTADNIVAGNNVGVGLDGTTALGNTNFGIGLVSAGPNGVSSNVIGSNDDGISDGLEGNLIANNGLDGLGIFATGAGPAAGNRFSRNSYYNNLNSAINLNVAAAGSPACNLPNSGTPGAATTPNNFYDHPVLESVTLSGSTVSFKGWTLPGSTVEFYTVDGVVSRPCTTPEVLDFEEGKTFLISAKEGSGSDLDAGVSAYTAALEGTNPGTSFTANRFQFDFNFTLLGGTVNGDPSGSGIVALAISDGTQGQLGSTSQFSAMVVATGTLPVTLLNFDAVGAQGKVNISWSTATETNSDYFDVERSADGVHFSTVGTVNAKGNSTSVSKYSLVDGNPINGVSYYRLKEVDIDGRFTYSKVVIVRSNGASARVLISPNPARTQATITLTLDQAQSLQVRVFDNTGRATRSYRFSGAAGVNKFDLNDIGNLPSGVYNVEIIGTSTHARERFVKN